MWLWVLAEEQRCSKAAYSRSVSWFQNNLHVPTARGVRETPWEDWFKTWMGHWQILSQLVCRPTYQEGTIRSPRLPTRELRGDKVKQRSQSHIDSQLKCWELNLGFGSRAFMLNHSVILPRRTPKRAMGAHGSDPNRWARCGGWDGENSPRSQSLCSVLEDRKELERGRRDRGGKWKD